MTHEEIRDDLSLLALGTLDDDERRAVEAHLAGCSECERELAQWREVVGVLPLAVEDSAPPNLKSALLARLSAPEARRKVVALRRRWVAPLAAAAALILLIGGLVRDRQWRLEVEAQRQTTALLRSDLAAARESFTQISQALTERERDLAGLRAGLASAQASLAILQNPGLQLVRLKEAPQAQPGEAHLLVSPSSGQALLYAFDLQAVPADKAYELWWITEKEGPVNAGVFRPDDRGLGRIVTAVPTNLGAIQAAAVTIEPAAGVPKPTGPMVLLGSIQSSGA